ncbi:uncharacterized protein IL334_002778 [Kwoniella shivajii]|uniref:Uncharacterized protein n=1 Tax=Kwoniella shivajii TaxID=564305 RepID=A0ABZ1CVN7_9TREE|nr:hypothetical protein IL334_002778 [Kwoniella shivajii]
MPLAKRARQSSPGYKPTKLSRTPAKKPRASEPAPKGSKRKSADDDEEYDTKQKNVKDGKKRKIQEIGVEEEGVEFVESDDEEESNKSKDTQEGLQTIFKDLSSKFQLKKGKKSNKKGNADDKQIAKLDEMYDEVLEQIEEWQKGENGLDHRQQKINDLFLHVDQTLVADTSRSQGLQMLLETHATRWTDFYPHYLEFSNEDQRALRASLTSTISSYEQRPKSIGKTIKVFTKLQKDRLKKIQDELKVNLDSQKMLQHSRKMMHAFINC